MKQILFISSLLLLLSSFSLEAQQKRRSYVTVKGKVTDHNNEPIKNAYVFIDMNYADVRTNNKGEYKIKIAPIENLISVYHERYGFINWSFQGEKKVNFNYPEYSEVLTEEEMEDLGFNFKKIEKNWYSGFASVTDILLGKFSNVRIVDGEVLIGRMGTNVVTGDPRPLFLVNDVPTDVSQIDLIPTTEIYSIQVLDKASDTAAYGFRGVNGVIIIKLKSGETDMESNQ